MRPILTARAMQEADRATIEDYGLPGFTLMETASRGTLRHVARRFGPLRRKRVVLLCGKGNNGGDGLALARLLYERGSDVRVVTLGPAGELSPDARRNFDLLKRLVENDQDGRLHLHEVEDAEVLAHLPPADLYVDALLGTGLTSALREPVLSLVRWLEGRSEPVVAVDVPTGLHTDTGEVLGQNAKVDEAAVDGLVAAVADDALRQRLARIGKTLYALEPAANSD